MYKKFIMIIKNNVILHPGQKRIIKEIYNNKVKYNIIKTGRQFGKTVLGQIIASKEAIGKENFKCLWTSPTIPQARKIYKTMLDAYPKEIIKEKSDTYREIILTNGTKIEFHGVEKPNNLRGDNTDLFILDEFAFYKEDVWAVLKPFLMKKNKDAMCVMISTPRGMENEFYRLYQLGLDNNDRYRSYNGIYTENPYYDLTEIEDARNSLPTNLFRQEYLGEFVKDGSSVFSNVDLCSNIIEFMPPLKDLVYYNGNDLAKQKDWTVSTTMNNKCEVVNIHRIRRMDWSIIVDSVVNELKLYNPKLSYFEVNGVGDAPFDYVRKKHPNGLIPFVMTNQSKQAVISRLIYNFNTKRISIPTKQLMPSLHEQLNTFTFTYSKKSRQISYHAADGFHDDDVISLALANNAWYLHHGRK